MEDLDTGKESDHRGSGQKLESVDRRREHGRASTGTGRREHKLFEARHLRGHHRTRRMLIKTQGWEADGRAEVELAKLAAEDRLHASRVKRRARVSQTTGAKQRE
jgi:hypothetical protein